MKTIFLSKTFWVQAIALLMLLAPPVKLWFDANPVGYLAALAAVNVLLRFATSGRVSISLATPDTDGDGVGNGGKLPGGSLLAGLAGVVGFPLPACTPSQLDAAGKIPVKACYIDEAGNSVCYGPESGLEVSVDRRRSK